MNGDSLTVDHVDILSLAGSDLLHVPILEITGAVIGNGTLETYGERLVKTGTLAETVNLVCLSDNLLIPEFHTVEEIFKNDPDLLFLVPIALEVPAVKEYR
ncbi:MAG: hypothetical protein PHQ75_01470 [Thermoguttaceae bacterium]|nr:hypothetical protein [Thermoguttaceae bacterium]